MSNKNQGISSHDSSPGRQVSCELSSRKKPLETAISEKNNNKLLDKTFTIDNCVQGKIICYARNCTRIAVSTLILTAGSKQIPIHVCLDYKSKFE